MNIIRLDLNNPIHCEKWDGYVSKKGPTGLNSLSAYLRAIVNSLGHKNISLIALNDTQDVIGALPLILTKSALFGTFSTSIPFFNYGGVLADDVPTETRLLQDAFELCRLEGASSVQLRESRDCEHIIASDPSIQCLTHKVHMRMPLPAPGEPIGEGNAKQRAKLKSQAGLFTRKSQEEGFSTNILFGHAELLDDFYTVFSRHMRDLGTPVYSKKWFRGVLSELKDSAKLVVVYMDKNPVATAFLIQHGNYLNIPWASTLKRVNHYSVNTFMYWHIIQHAQEKDVKILDFGRSTEGEGTYRFKKQWGAIAYPCYWLNKPLGEKGKVDNLSPTNPKFSLAIKIWQNLPLWLTNMIGPGIVKNIP